MYMVAEHQAPEHQRVTDDDPYIQTEKVDIEVEEVELKKFLILASFCR
jgi:hypothetical protein